MYFYILTELSFTKMSQILIIVVELSSTEMPWAKTSRLKCLSSFICLLKYCWIPSSHLSMDRHYFHTESVEPFPDTNIHSFYVLSIL